MNFKENCILTVRLNPSHIFGYWEVEILDSADYIRNFTQISLYQRTAHILEDVC